MLDRKVLKAYRKLAFEIGVGATVGVYVGKCVNGALEGVMTVLVKRIKKTDDESKKNAGNKEPEEPEEYANNYTEL